MAGQAPYEAPVAAAQRGLVAGLAASLLLSALARVLPAMRQPVPASNKTPPPPRDPFDPNEVRRWQMASQSPAGVGGALPAAGSAARPTGARIPGALPGEALRLPQGPGPEGLAEQFAYKLVSGVFNRDISDVLRPAGIATHLAYGSSWGALYGLLQATHRRPPAVFGSLYGLLVWLVGPAALLPAMRLLRLPWEEPPARAAMLLAGHVVYGLALASAFEALRLSGRRR